MVNKEYIKPASFDFILAGKSDELAIKDINQARTALPPMTPARNSSSAVPSTVKTSKKIRISVPIQSTTDPSTSVVAVTSTPAPSTTKKPANAALKELLTIFPEMKENEKEILNWTMEELLDRLVKAKVDKFEEFLMEVEME